MHFRSVTGEDIIYSRDTGQESAFIGAIFRLFFVIGGILKRYSGRLVNALNICPAKNPLMFNYLVGRIQIILEGSHKHVLLCLVCCCVFADNSRQAYKKNKVPQFPLYLL